MNETLYSWTFKFHKVVRQQNSGVVEDFILSYSAVYLRIQKWKDYWNQSTFAKVIVKIKVARFYGPRCICQVSTKSILAGNYTVSGKKEATSFLGMTLRKLNTVCQFRNFWQESSR